MSGFRKALAEYALSYANEKMKPVSKNSVTAFTEIGSDYCAGTFETFVSAVNNPGIIREAAEFFRISDEKAAEYLSNTVIYSHGLLALVVSGVLKADRQTVRDKINNAGFAFLSQAGGDTEKAAKADNRLLPPQN